MGGVNMYVFDKALERFLKTLLIIAIIVIAIIVIINNITLDINLEEILLRILGKFVDIIRSLFGISYGVSKSIINNFKLP
jgi:hypothetical protein